MCSPECFFGFASANAAMSQGCGYEVRFQRQRRGMSQQLTNVLCATLPTLPPISPPVNIYGIYKNARGAGFFWLATLMAPVITVNVLGRPRCPSCFHWTLTTKTVAASIAGHACGANVVPLFPLIRRSQELNRTVVSDK